MAPYVRIRRGALFSRECSAPDLPLQARMLNRCNMMRLSESSLRDMITSGALPAQDDPDAVNALYAQGW